MKRPIIMLVAASLALGGCSGGKSKDDAAAKPSEAAKSAMGGKAEEEHVNPWAKDGAPGSAATEAAEPKKDAPAPKKEEAHVNPWAKDGAPGSAEAVAAAEAEAKDKAKAKK